MIESTNSSTSTTGQQNQEQSDKIRDLGVDDFLKLMIAELSNQDPLSPKENSEIMQQVSQIREIEASAEEVEASEKLTATLDAVLLGQSLSNASGLIGKTVDAETSQHTGDGGVEIKQITGKVTSVSIDENTPVLHITEAETDTEYTIQVSQLRSISDPDE